MALFVGFLILVKPEVGVLLLFAMILFKYPEFVEKYLQGSGRLTPNNLLGVILSGILLVSVALRRDLWFLKARQVQILLFIGLLLFVNWMLAGRIEAPDYLSTLDLTGRTLERFIVQLSLIIFAVAFIRTPQQLLLLTLLFVCAVLLTMPGAISYALTGIEEAGSKVERLRAAATSGVQAAENANRLAFLALMGISLIWFALLEYRVRLLQVLGGMAIFVLIFAVLLSGSRSGMLNLLILPWLLLAPSGLSRRQRAVTILLIVLGIGVSLLFVPEAILQRLVTFSAHDDDVAASESLSYRWFIVQLGLQIVAEHPFLGVGIGNVRWATALHPAADGFGMTPHNAYLLALIEGGIFLLAAYLLLFWQTFRDLNTTLQLAVLAPDLRLRWLLLATRVNLVMLLLFSFFAEAWKEFYYMLIIATAAVLSQLYTRAAQRTWLQFPSSM
jgi:O-antigen ligase